MPYGGTLRASRSPYAPAVGPVANRDVSSTTIGLIVGISVPVIVGVGERAPDTVYHLRICTMYDKPAARFASTGIN